MQVVVTGCKNCPLCHTDSEWATICEHPLSIKDPNIEYEYYDRVHGNGSPDWCKLAKEPLIITKPTNTKTQTYMTIKPDENEQWRYK